MRTRHIPERTCIGCGCKRPKPELLRFVCPPAGEIQYDPKKRLPGRGCYLCRNAPCLQAALQRRGLDRAYRRHISRETYKRFETLVQQLIDHER